MKNKITQIEEEQPIPKEAFENSYPITKEEAAKKGQIKFVVNKVNVLTAVINLLIDLPPEDQAKVLNSAAVFFNTRNYL